jgi:steroid delta-isomerase-like uncharacterized protein
MQALEIAQRYFDAWNRRDAAVIVAAFSEGGTYADPVCGALSGPAIGAYAEALWAAFPDLSFEIASAGLAGENLVAAEWTMRGTNLGSMNGLPPTGRSVTTRGADFITVRDGKILSVQGYFDSRSVPEQLDLAVVVQPKQIGPFTFGVSTHAGNGSAAKPGAFSITMLEVRSKAEEQQVADWGRTIATEMLGMPGFIGWMGATIGPRMITVTAWEDAEAPKQMLRTGSHAGVMQHFFGPSVARGGFTSVWEPVRINSMWNRCSGCGQMVDHEASDGRCRCGSALPAPPRYW